MSAARKGVIKWTPASVLRSVPFILLGLTAACSDGGSSPSFVDDGFKRHGELSITPNQLAVREGDSVAVRTSLVGGSSFDPSKVSWTVQPARAGVVRGGYFVAEYYGDVTLTAVYSGATATAGAHVLPAPRAIQTLGADFVAGTAGKALPDSVSIKVTGRDGVAVPDVDVLFQVDLGGGTLSTSQARTDDYGVARVKWTLGSGAGRNTLRASIPTVGEVRLEAQGYADLASATVELLGGGGQEGRVGEVLAEPVVVRVSDANGNPIRGVTLEWAFVGGEGSESGMFTGVPAVASVTRAITDVGGVSQMYWRLGTLAGDQVGSASVVAAAAAPGGNGHGGKGGGSGKKDFSAHGKPGSLAGVTVSPDQAELAVDDQTTLEAMPTDKWGNVIEASVSWSVSDTDIATVDANGVVSGVLPGDVDVNAVADGQVSGTASVTVLTGAPATIEQTGSGQTATAGQKLSDPLTARVFDQYGVALADVNVTWNVASGGGSLSSLTSKTNADGVASVEWTLGSTAGAQSVTATVQGVSPATYEATAEEAPVAPSIASVTVSPDPLTLIIGAGHGTMTATAKDASGNTMAASFTWTSSNPSVASVNSTGAVMPLAIGEAEIRATADGVTGVATVLVQVDSTTTGGGGTDGSGSTVGSVQASKDALSFTALGATKSLSAIGLDLTGNPLDGISFSWSSTNTGVATVDGNGNVVSKSVGTAAIIVSAVCCTAADTVGITVTQMPNSIEVTPASLSLQVGSTRQLSAVVKDANGYPVPGASVTWSSTNPGVAAISPSGLAQALATGSVAFEARSDALMGASQATISEQTTTGGGGASR